MNSRSGAALIIAIVVLAAMLLLGLPFLFTQSGSLSGTRSYSHSQLASVGQDSAQSMGVAAGASAVSYHWQQDGVTQGGRIYQDDWSDLFLDLGGRDPQSGLRRVGVNRIEFDTRNHTFALPGDAFLNGLAPAERDALLQRYPTVVGLAIEDESGKLNPNHMETRAWSLLLEAVNIADWTDGLPPVADVGRKQLARALANLRYQLPSGRITALDQLLQAEPPSTKAGTDDPVPLPRRGLTRAELERLRPYLTLAVPAQARGGLIDLGTVIGMEGSRVMLDHDAPSALLAFPAAPLLVGVGTTLVLSDDNDSTLTIPAFGETARLPKTGAAVAIDAPPAVNLHQAEDVVRRSFAPGPLPPTTPPDATRESPIPAIFTELNQLPNGSHTDMLGRSRMLFDLLSPLIVVDRQGMTHVTGSVTVPAPGDGPVSPPFDTAGNCIDSAGIAVLDARANVLHITTGSLDRFPPRGFALLEGEIADTGTSAQEIIEYQSSVPTLPLSAANAAAGMAVTLKGVRRGVNGSGAKRFRAGLTTDHDGSLTGIKQGDLHLTALTVREQQPVGIASAGVITIASTATVTDPAGNQTAQDRHRVIAQALPQEEALEARWDKQAAFHALLAQRHGSLMASFPTPYPRLSDVLPQDAANITPPNTRYVPPISRTDLDHSVGLRPAAMRTLLTHSHLDYSWRLSFGGSNSGALKFTSTNPNTNIDPLPWDSTKPTEIYRADDIVPEGLRLDKRRVLSYPNPGNSGFLRDSYNANKKELEPIHGRQFGLWVRPDAEWNQPVVLFDCQLPDENVAESLSGVLRPDQPWDDRGEISKGASNLFRLAYEPKAKLLILSLNPGTIQQVNDYGPFTPRELFGIQAGEDTLPLRSGAYPAVNPECLGSGGKYRMAAAPPAQVQTIQHCTYVGDAFVPGEWHQIQVVFSSNQPGGMAIIVDGLVGREVTRLASAASPAAMTVPGDHLTLPTLVLRTDIADTPTISQDGAKALYLAEIPLDACARAADNSIITGANAVQAVLPKRGIIRIGDEYISYDEISASGSLLRCVRGRRQRTDASSNNSGTINWGGAHKLQAHKNGDLVVPGGFAMRNLGGNWFRGGCSLKYPLPDGDPANLFRVSGALVAKTVGGSSTLVLKEIAGATASQLPSFPPHGFLLWNEPGTIVKPAPEPPENILIPHLLYFAHPASAPAAPLTLSVWHWNPSVIPDPSDPMKTIPIGWTVGIPVGTDIPIDTEMVLVSTELNGDPTVISRSYDWLYADRNDNPMRVIPVTGGREDYGARMVQLYDARESTNAGDNCGRAEWIIYTAIESRTTFPSAVGDERRTYLMNLMQMREPGITYDQIRGGFWFNSDWRLGARGRQRTAFAASDFKMGAYNPTTHAFPAGTRVIPVQTTITSPDSVAAGKGDYPVTFLLEAGDVVTLAQAVMTGSELPLQMCVRYSANDGFPDVRVDPSGPLSWNVMNRFFAFSEAIPPTWNEGDKNFHLLAWPCWTPEGDLSPLPVDAWAMQRMGWLMPWGNAYAPQFTPNADGTNRPLTIGLSTSASDPGIAATIDAIHSGGTNGWSEDNGRNDLATELVQANVLPADANPWLLDVPMVGRIAIQADSGIFAWPYGLVDIGGEVFAYQRPGNDTTAAYLIGRSLLGSTRRIHQGKELVLHLPIGPVAEVVDALPLEFTGRVQFSGYFAAPAMLLTSRNGEAMELTTMPNSYTAPWLRGLYNSTPVAWQGRASAAAWDTLTPLAIGWWPRYPSAYANDTFASSHLAQSLRCRSYAWAGFPLRFHDCVFTGTNSADLINLDDAAGMLQLCTTALDGTLDWSAAKMLSRSESPGVTPIDISDVFTSERFRDANNPAGIRWLNTGVPHAVDGAELRVLWTYRAARMAGSALPSDWLQQAARNGNRAPMIGPVRLRAHAPNKVINVER